MSHGNTKTLREAAIEILEEVGPTHYQELTDRILQSGLASTSSKSPATSLNVTINVDIKRNGNKSDFIRISPGVFGLRSRHSRMPSSTADTGDGIKFLDITDLIASADGSEQIVRISQFPIYREARLLLRVWNGHPRRQVTGLQNAFHSVRGTPRNALDWTDPDGWIPERLSGDSQNLAAAIWSKSNKTVNPRYTYGHWLFSQTYKLIDESPDGLVRVTKHGWDFIKHEGGNMEALLDEQEGLTKLLALVADNGPVRARGILGEWTEHLKRHSKRCTQSPMQASHILRELAPKSLWGAESSKKFGN